MTPPVAVGTPSPVAAPTFSGQLLRRAHRLPGTLLGLGLSAALFAMKPKGLVLVVVIVGLQIAAELLVGAQPRAGAGLRHAARSPTRRGCHPTPQRASA